MHRGVPFATRGRDPIHTNRSMPLLAACCRTGLGCRRAARDIRTAALSACVAGTADALCVHGIA